MAANPARVLPSQLPASARTSGGTGGHPTPLGYVHFTAAGVTIQAQRDKRRG
jgi:hypothetical protein